MTFDKDTLRTFNNYLSKIAILIVPGMVIVELVFHKGLLSGNIHDFPALILLIAWSFTFSVPYYATATITMIWLRIPLERLTKGEELLQTNDDYEEPLFLTILLVLITFGLYKVTLWLNWLSSETYAGIKREYILCVASVGLTILLSLPLAVIYYRVAENLITSMIWRKQRREKGDNADGGQ